MNKKINLALATFLLGGLVTILPPVFQMFILASGALLLFNEYEEWQYNQSFGGAK